MHIDAGYRLLDTLLDAFDVTLTDGDAAADLENRIWATFVRLTKSPPCVEDFTSFHDSAYSATIAKSHKASWIAQALFGGRPCCVNQRLFLSNGMPVSPIIEQMSMRGMRCAAPDMRHLKRDLLSRYDWASQLLDALLVQSDRNTVFIVRACSYSQVKRYSTSLEHVAYNDNLFEPDRALLRGAAILRDLVGSLMLARDLISACAPDVTVKPVLFVVDDREGSWNFQCHDMTELNSSHVSQNRVSLDRFPVLHSIKDFPSLSRKHSGFNPLPNASRCFSLEHYLRDAVPVDRGTRCLMMLREVYQRQLRSTGGLEVVRAQELADLVNNEYRVFYPPDQRRHDIEDSLWRSGFIDRPFQTENAYAIKAKGIARMAVLKTKLNPMIPRYTRSLFFDMILDNYASWRRCREAEFV